MPTEVPGSVPGTDDKQLARVACRLPELPDIGAEPADRFAQAVRTLVEKRARNEWPNEGDADVAVFVMVDYPRQIGERHGAVPFADPASKEDPILGRLFFANRDASFGRSMPIPIDPNAIIEWIDEKGLGDSPIVTVYRKSMEIVTRRSGNADSAKTDQIRDQEPPATLPELVDALTHFHKERLLTPVNCPKGVWEKERAHQYIPGSAPEKSIQADLELALNSWFRGVLRAKSEDSTNIGRIDIRLLGKNAKSGTLEYWAILELKVIKSFTNAPQGVNPSKVSTSANINAIVEGVKQVGSFQKNCRSEHGLLEIYDLRKDKTENLVLRAEVSDAKSKFIPRPEINVWPIFGTSKHARDAGFSGA